VIISRMAHRTKGDGGFARFGVWVWGLEIGLRARLDLLGYPSWRDAHWKEGNSHPSVGYTGAL
jgi:hypothetical protein